MKWIAEQPVNANGWWVVCDEQGCELGSADGGFYEEQARLMAAAPDLLESLNEVIKYFDAPGDGCFSDEALERARNAVKKATGHIEQRREK